ncbi:substrate-binding periplasmic protein [Kordiimonas lipolytica]|uniref:Substrate-binding periplasmic protein n=1 Tax=Kordiimonas lipolytica TaxID=1662421 RepID=A0ABV8U9J9_9PROT|nr:transporter substrate-binding domain-containing protein [Kordiimonas lipolytica]
MRLIVGVIILLFLTQASAAQTLTLLTEENPPLNYTDAETGEITGAATELVTAILDAADVDFTIRSLPWARAFRQARDTANHCVFATVRSEEREDRFEWVSPLFVGGWALYKRPGSALDVTAIDKLEGHVVAAMAGTAALAKLKSATNAEVVTAQRDDTALALLYHGRADLWLSGVFAAPHSAKTAGLPMPEVAFIWRPSVIALACSKGTDPQLMERLRQINAGLNDLHLMARYHYGAP